MKVEHIPNSKLYWSNLWNDLGMTKDKGGRLHPTESTPDWVKEYLEPIRAPSRSWPNSYATALLTMKFAKYIITKDPELAVKLGVAKKVEE